MELDELFPEDDDESDASRDRFYADLAKDCRCCPQCETMPPCDGCAAGGICDHSGCTCGEEQEEECEEEDREDV